MNLCVLGEEIPWAVSGTGGQVALGLSQNSEEAGSFAHSKETAQPVDWIS